MAHTKKPDKTTILAICVLAALLAIAGAFLLIRRPPADLQEKTISVTITTGADAGKVYSITTEAAFLRGALEEQGLIRGEESALGLFITEVDGIVADDAMQQWWCLMQDGDSLLTGVDETPIADGDSFEIVLMTGY